LKIGGPDKRVSDQETTSSDSKKAKIQEDTQMDNRDQDSGESNSKKLRIQQIERERNISNLQENIENMIQEISQVISETREDILEEDNYLNICQIEDDLWESVGDYFEEVDDVNGGNLPGDLVQEAMKEEITFMEGRNTWTKSPGRFPPLTSSTSSK
jgi:hypothetical protein